MRKVSRQTLPKWQLMVLVWVFFKAFVSLADLSKTVPVSACANELLSGPNAEYYFNPSKQILANYAADINELVPDNTPYRFDMFGMEYNVILNHARPIDKMVFEELMARSPVAKDLLSRVGKFNPETKTILFLSLSITAKHVEQGKYHRSNGSWHPDGANRSLIYVISDPDDMAPTELLLPSGVEVEKILSKGCDGKLISSSSLWIHEQLQCKELQVARGQSGQFIDLGTKTLHRSTPAKYDGRRYFMRWYLIEGNQRYFDFLGWTWPGPKS